MTRVELFLVACLVATCLSVEAVGQDQRAEIQLWPDRLPLYEGSTATFNCTSFRYDTITWLMDNKPVTDFNPKVYRNSTDERRLYSSFSIPAILRYNNSKVLCIGVSINNGNQITNESTLLVQGVPGKVEGFQGTNVTSKTIQFIWSPPFHIPGTVCCIAYSVNITHIESGDAIHIGNTTDLTISFEVPLHQLCHLYDVQISAYNKLGEGELLQTIWSLGGFFEANSADLSLLYTKEQNLILGVNITIEGYCLNKLDNVTLSVICDSSQQIVKKTNDISAGHDVTLLKHSISVVLPSTHHDSTCTFSVALGNDVSLKGIEFNTFDVQDANYTTFPGEVCISCMYLPYSPARGCVLAVSEVGVNSDVEYSTNIPLNNKMGCVSIPRGGRYRLRVFDWEYDGNRNEQYIKDIVIQVENPTTIVPSTSSFNAVPTIEASSEGLGELAVGGITAASVLVLLVILVAMIVGAICIAVVILKRGQANKSQDRIQTDGTEKPLDLTNFIWKSVETYENLSKEVEEECREWYEGQQADTKFGYARPRYVLLERVPN